MAQPSTENQEDFWLFGYGSLIWKPPPRFGKHILFHLTVDFPPNISAEKQQKLIIIGDQDRRAPGYIDGYVRRFWQASEDHRGTPAHPGRVVTLIDRPHYDCIVPPSTPPPSYRVWGAAYHIPQQHVNEVQEYLDIREINGYSIQYAPFQPASREERPIEKCMVYIGLPSNPQFLGPQDLDKLAAKIWRCKGPSGENRDYLFMLEEALKGLGDGAEDEHVEELAKRTRETGMASGENGAALGNETSVEVAIEQVTNTTGSPKGTEEVEKP
ncbi:MAG: hypothetical protein Q9192_001083 [Flavoplaca navasiana]